MPTTRYRTRIHHVDAVQYTGSNPDTLLAFLGGEQQARVEPAHLPGPGRSLTAGLRIHRLDATLDVRPTQWLVRHTTGDRTTYEVMWHDTFTGRYETDGEQED